ncbi:MAG: transposase [Treponema sp.]|nr:transposase [Treponema sp.]
MKSNYSREERQKTVEEYIRSGKSQPVFAPEYGIKPNTLSAWVTKYKKAGIEIEIPGNSNTVIIREILAAMASL